jgi:RNA polymerase sigma-70 factor (ECF subfamily)
LSTAPDKPVGEDRRGVPRERGGSRADVSDDALLVRTADGDRNAWSVLVERHLTAVVRYASYSLRDGALAEDIAQETFLRLARKAADWTAGGPSLRAWLYRVARNLCIDQRRANRTDPIEGIEAMPDPLAGLAINRTIDIETRVRQALDALPERQKAAIVLVHFEGLTGQEAGDAMGVSVEALESLLARGRRTLRHDLASLAPDLLGEH